MIHQDIDSEQGEVRDLRAIVKEKRSVASSWVKLPENQRRALKDLIRRYSDVFTDMPREPDVI